MSKRESLMSRQLGWVVAVLFVAQSILLSFLPRIDKYSALRQDLGEIHYTLGLLLIIAVAMRLWRWFKEEPVLSDTGLSAGQQSFNRAISLAWLMGILFAGTLGFFYGWAEGRTLTLFGLFDLPELLPKDHAVWMFTGYFHSASAMMSSLFAIIMVVVGTTTLFRRNVGVLAAFPAGFGAMGLASVLVLVYVLNSFQNVNRGFIAAGCAALLMGLIGWLGKRRKANSVGEADAALADKGTFGKAGAFVAIAAVLGVAGYGPYASYGVVPWAMGSVVEADPEITWHQERLVKVEVSAPTPLQDAVEQDAYKWCKFCHTTKAGEAHLIGPNLHNIIGQQAGTVPNFHYSEAMAQAGREGLVWDEETIKKFIAGPEKVVPGNRMVVNRGPVTDPDEQDAVLNLLKRDTMVGE